jgi:DNA-binding response OmpR family regulator
MPSEAFADPRVPGSVLVGVSREAHMEHTARVQASMINAQDMPSRPVIWILDDDRGTAEVASLLDAEGFEARGCHFTTALDALRARVGDPTLIIVELIQSGIGGLVLCSKLRALTEVPIVVYSRTRRSGDPSACRRLGANAFVHKSSPTLHLMLEIRRLAGLSSREAAPEAPSNSTVLRVGALAVETSAPRAILNGTPFALTPTEHRVMLVLANAPGTVVSKRDLALNVWGSAAFQQARSLSAHVQKIRAKLQRASVADAPQLTSMRGMGYALTLPSTEGQERAQPPQAA